VIKSVSEDCLGQFRKWSKITAQVFFCFFICPGFFFFKKINDLLTQQIKYVRRGRRERKKDLDTFYLISAIYT